MREQSEWELWQGRLGDCNVISGSLAFYTTCVSLRLKIRKYIHEHFSLGER